jgi:lysine biosynthesis protein LysW
MAEFPCLECGFLLHLPQDFQAGELTDCENCGVALEIIQSQPLRLALFEEEEK